MYTIHEVCKKLEMSPHTVRHYTDINLIPFVHRDMHGNRVFTEESLHWLQAAKSLRGSGMSLKEVKFYFDLCLKGEQTFEERCLILEDLRDRVKKELQEMSYRLECIENKIEHCKDIRDNKCVDDCNPLNW